MRTAVSVTAVPSAPLYVVGANWKAPARSRSTMVTVAVASARPTPALGPSRVTLNVRLRLSSGRLNVVTVNVWLVTPAANVRVPDFVV